MLADLRRSVIGRSIIDYDNFNVIVFLKQNGLKVPHESVAVGVVESRHNHTSSQLLRKRAQLVLALKLALLAFGECFQRLGEVCLAS